MRFIKKLAVSAVAAAALIGGALLSPATANAAVPFDAPWGPVFSADHKAEANGHVRVEDYKYKQWYWKHEKVDFNCSFKHKAKKFCHWKWVEGNKFHVRFTLDNDGWKGHHKFKCAWATFKIEPFHGPDYFKKFKNCGKHPKSFWFSGKNAEHISVVVSRGDHWKPRGFWGAWTPIYDA
ncbi:hypothetical protein Aph01nite_20850 [Acrocarpospora phusangensis]|uniref:Uncharacterized protein n=1 Tax=Acrocarpospora phusangensis TaxID=1070424 RepID=A0A919QAI5_9ACTN|nr:hypothetical protein [Acrocarpospora phusangensis]GIH23775.1 hypothetical protein Aph01nite_20850 [Acrocarpospora phusangensis]